MAPPTDPLAYLAGYPDELVAGARRLLEAGDLEQRILARYPDRHDVRSNKVLFDYVQELKARVMRKAPPLSKVLFDDKLQVVENALGLHTTSTRIHGQRVHKRREIRVSGLFKDAPEAFLRMIVVHELAHMKHADHDRDFYRLCAHMEPEYGQLELDTRLWLAAREKGD